MTTHIYFDKDKADEGLARLDVELMQRWQNSKFPLSDEGYKAMLERAEELSDCEVYAKAYHTATRCEDTVVYGGAAAGGCTLSRHVEGYMNLSKVITPIGEESALYGCVGDESGCFDKGGV